MEQKVIVMNRPVMALLFWSKWLGGAYLARPPVVQRSSEGGGLKGNEFSRPCGSEIVDT